MPDGQMRKRVGCGRRPRRQAACCAALSRLTRAARLTACSTVDGPDAFASTEADVPPRRFRVKNYPRFGDNDPHEWEGGTPWHYAVHGTDVSKYQTSIDWHKAKSSGVSFAFIKATEGGDRIDDYFDEHWATTKAAGVPRSAYHFYYFCRPAAEQARLVHPERAERPLGACRRCSTWSGTRIRRPAS